MSFYRLLSNNLAPHRLYLRPLTLLSRPQMISQCLHFSSSECKFSSIATQDIKRKVLKNLNIDPEAMRYGREIVIYESALHGYYRNIAMIGIGSYVFWVFLANFGIFWYSGEVKKKELDETEMTKPIESTGLMAMVKSKLRSMMLSNESMLRLSGLFLLFGHLILSATVIFCIRTVLHISFLRSASGPDIIRIYCYSIFGLPNTYHKHDLAINQISALRNRVNTKSRYIPLKVKGELLKYRIDRRGHFVQPSIFDQTVGVKRNF